MSTSRRRRASRSEPPGTVSTAGIDEEIYIASQGQGRLSQLLVKAAVLSQNSAAPDDGHSLGQFMVTGLKQTAGSLRRHPSFETQEGQRQGRRRSVCRATAGQSRGGRHDPR